MSLDAKKGGNKMNHNKRKPTFGERMQEIQKFLRLPGDQAYGGMGGRHRSLGGAKGDTIQHGGRSLFSNPDA